MSTNAQIIMTMALAPRTSDTFTYPEAMNSSQHEHWNQVKEEECTLILLKNTFRTVNCLEARQL
jgi:hypothetical protein